MLENGRGMDVCGHTGSATVESLFRISPFDSSLLGYPSPMEPCRIKSLGLLARQPLLNDWLAQDIFAAPQAVSVWLQHNCTKFSIHARFSESNLP